MIVYLKIESSICESYSECFKRLFFFRLSIFCLVLWLRLLTYIISICNHRPWATLIQDGALYIDQSFYYIVVHKSNHVNNRSKERRVGKECRYRLSSSH